jgi:hypothetical protein
MRVNTLNALLHNMVSILVLNTLQDMSIKFTHNLLLLVRRDGLQSFLDHTTTIHLQCKW